MIEEQIFRKGSTTYYWSSKFFPKNVRQDVFDLYSFVRVADDYVDQNPSDKEGFYRLRRKFIEAKESSLFETSKQPSESVDDRVVKNIIRLQQKYNLDWTWVDAFLDAMQSDLIQKRYLTLDDSLEYVFGSAEVIGLMMSRIMGLSEIADEQTRMQGRAMQWINFIRDISEDNELGRSYFPDNDLRKFGLIDLSEQTARSHHEPFREFINFQLERYYEWQEIAENGYRYIPKRQRIALKTASDMYGWTGECISKDPLVVYKKKIKPSKSRIISKILTNVI